MKSFFISIILLLLSTSQSIAECGMVNSILSMDIPAVSYAGQLYHATFERDTSSGNPDSIDIRLVDLKPATALNACAQVNEDTLAISVSCAEYEGNQYALEFSLYKADDTGMYWRLTGAETALGGGNHTPVADTINLTVDPITPYVQQQLSGRDSDNDIITYELLSPATSNNYTTAYLNPNSGMLYFTVAPGASSFTLSYRVTDGLLFSEPSMVNIEIDTLVNPDRGMGSIDIAPEEYARFQMTDFNDGLLGVNMEAATQPLRIDLSSNFPIPGDQGNQNSCVGWALAYALKSFQEKVEVGWELNDTGHLFSPAFIYNQIVVGNDRGASISDALDLAVESGIASLETMPYNGDDYLTLPPPEAFTEASRFKAASWARVSDHNQLIAALVNRKPVVCGIRIYPSFSLLQGPDAVYNTITGPLLGGHAVTIVGYDSEKFGGAYKIMNSYGQQWGDNGFFWLPYELAESGVLTQAYVLDDLENTPGSIPAPITPTVSAPTGGDLPNLVVSSWEIPAYDPRPRGLGTLTYTVTNAGTGTAPAGADINLMLSHNAEISSNDYYVIYETIPFPLDPGQSVYRDEQNALSFQLPDNLPPGTYYIAVWVDDLNVVKENDEYDNITMADSTVTIENNLPDLLVNSWYAEWDAFGMGQLTYTVINNGASATSSAEWYINLILDRDMQVNNGNEIYLFYEQADYILEPGQYVYRDASFAAHFSLYTDFDDHPVPPGIYYMGLWVDDLETEEESNELNNGSYRWGSITVESLGTGRNSVPDEAEENNTDQIFPNSGYNGRRLPAGNMVMRKVEISRDESGLLGFTFLPDDKEKIPVHKGNRAITVQTKRVPLTTKVIFPRSEKLPMPGGGQVKN